MTPDLSALARRSAMLREAAGALPTGRERDLLLIRLHELEDQLRATGSAAERVTTPHKFYSDAAE
jgi:hypothetical protein